MAMKMKDFLSEYYKRLIFRDMPIEQFAQYCEYVKANDFNGNMGDWRSLLEKDPADPTGRTFLIDPACAQGNADGCGLGTGRLGQVI